MAYCIQKPEKVRTSIYFIYHFTLTDSVRLIHVWKVVCGHSLPFDMFFGTMIGVELFPGRDVFDTQNLVPFSDTEISFNVSAVRAWLLWAETRLSRATVWMLKGFNGTVKQQAKFPKGISNSGTLFPPHVLDIRNHSWVVIKHLNYIPSAWRGEKTLKPQQDCFQF